VRLAARFIATLAVVFVMVPALYAQTPPKVEWFLGYSFWRAMPTQRSNRMGYLHGGSTSVAYNFHRSVGLVADFAGFDNSKITLLSPTGSSTVASSGRAYTYLLGPRFSYRKHESFTPFFQVLLGGVHASPVTISGCTIVGPSCTPLGRDNAFAAMLGTGFDIKVSPHVALRLFEGDFLVTRFFSTNGQGRQWQKNVRLSTGIVFRFGSTDAPVASAGAACSAQPADVFAGEPVNGTASGSNFDPKRTIQYNWSGTGVRVAGTNASTRIDTTGLQPGAYQVNANLSDGSKKGVASCTARFNVKQPRGPVIACLSDPGTIRAGGTVTIRSNASSPDNRRLTYSYSTSAGNVSGTDATATLNTGGAPPGTIRVTCNVSDDRNPALMASAATAVNVEAPPPPPPPPPAPLAQRIAVLEQKLALHSIYFRTNLPTASNPTAGPLESQKETLMSLARDFKEYLGSRPEAHLTLEGHADPRGTAEFNQTLTERRVERTRSFLIENGVPASSLQTKAFGKQQNLTDDEVKAAVQENPELNEADRQRVLKNMRAIILASNRRVDVVLSTTGQQSIRQFPFNAKDSLTLISTQSGGK
jgi:outer membrane protein OmpA-like peptidoglycan-associated protein